MPKITYVAHKFSAENEATIDSANDIIEEYERQGFSLTLRQLYYQFVSRDLIPNTSWAYKRLGSIINDGRLAGLIDWDAIEDRTRNLQSRTHWKTPEEIVQACARSFYLSRWADQHSWPEVWIEKDALLGVIQDACEILDVPYFSCRGYVSQSEMWSAAQRLERYRLEGHEPVIIHLGDHDPSGIDMTRDIRDRLELFTGGIDVTRIALTMEQVEEFSPPPNPAKITDSRAAGYMAHFGDESWELDALEPAMMANLIKQTVDGLRDVRLWVDVVEEEQKHKTCLADVAESWESIIEMLENPNEEE